MLNLTCATCLISILADTQILAEVSVSDMEKKSYIKAQLVNKLGFFQLITPGRVEESIHWLK